MADSPSPKQMMLPQEKSFKDLMVKMLKDDGEGHHHATYAKWLDDNFSVKIIDDPRVCQTAQMDAKNRTIEINSGFTKWPPKKQGEKYPKVFRHLSVLLRHELAHYLLKHEERMVKYINDKFGPDAVERIRRSKSLFGLDNIIADFDISNRRYTKDDKDLVRRLWINGREIQGLVTEDHRADWEKLSYEQMNDALNAEIDKLSAELVKELNAGNTDLKNIELRNMDRATPLYGMPDMIKMETVMAHYYVNTHEESNFVADLTSPDVLQEFIDDKALYHLIPYDYVDDQGNREPCLVRISSLPAEWQDVFKKIHAAFFNDMATATPITEADLDKIIDSISNSTIHQVVSVVDPRDGRTIEKLYTPEEKCFAIDSLKELRLYTIWFGKTLALLTQGGYTQSEIQELADSLR